MYFLLVLVFSIILVFYTTLLNTRHLGTANRPIGRARAPVTVVRVHKLFPGPVFLAVVRACYNDQIDYQK
jgi:hypothetical protein